MCQFSIKVFYVFTYRAICSILLSNIEAPYDIPNQHNNDFPAGSARKTIVLIIRCAVVQLRRRPPPIRSTSPGQGTTHWWTALTKFTMLVGPSLNKYVCMSVHVSIFVPSFNGMTLHPDIRSSFQYFLMFTGSKDNCKKMFKDELTLSGPATLAESWSPSPAVLG